LYVDTHVPGSSRPQPEDLRQRFVEAVEARIEGLAPGFRHGILERRVTAPNDFMRGNRNLVDGDLGGGSSVWSQQLCFRPFFRGFRYRMPVGRVYLCSSSTHPGGGAHGMCGYNAALRVIGDLASGHLAA
ncbi:MAG TPA: NAD(P)/FAD-dependent oxidoreductase, partial [Polyangiaceae bacterium]|nr:NAD(P)/FAD-dependent oxidoreductase [Polyangiaceae bacterium]